MNNLKQSSFISP